MAYSERIKNFARIRDIMRQFYVYGFQTRAEYTQKALAPMTTSGGAWKAGWAI